MRRPVARASRLATRDRSAPRPNGTKSRQKAIATSRTAGPTSAAPAAITRATSRWPYTVAASAGARAPSARRRRSSTRRGLDPFSRFTTRVPRRATSDARRIPLGFPFPTTSPTSQCASVTRVIFILGAALFTWAVFASRPLSSVRCSPARCVSPATSASSPTLLGAEAIRSVRSPVRELRRSLRSPSTGAHPMTMMFSRATGGGRKRWTRRSPRTVKPSAAMSCSRSSSRMRDPSPVHFRDDAAPRGLSVRRGKRNGPVPFFAEQRLDRDSERRCQPHGDVDGGDRAPGLDGAERLAGDLRENREVLLRELQLLAPRTDTGGHDVKRTLRKEGELVDDGGA